MRLPFIPTFILFVPAFLAAQVSTLPVEPGIAAPIMPTPYLNELKTYLTLTDAQVQSLQNVQNGWNQAQQAIYTQINNKYAALYSMLNAGTGTAAQLGQL